MNRDTVPLPAITVAICTRNRLASLQRTIASLMADGAVDWALLIVDSACSDATPAWLRKALPDLPVPAHSEREPRPGIGRARQRALGVVATPLMVFLDDDCTVEPGWLAAHRVAFADPQVQGTGGRILPVLPPGAPDWLAPFFQIKHGGPGGRFDFGEAALDLPVTPAGDMPFGANFGLRVAAARAAGGFDVALGWGAAANMPGEETDLMERIAAAGGRIRYVPDAIVRHHLQRDRVSERTYIRYHEAVARLQVLRERKPLAQQRPRSLATLVYKALRFKLKARLAHLLGRHAEALDLRRKEVFMRARLADRREQRRLERGVQP